MKAESFRIDVADAELDDLTRRIRATRWPDQIGADWVYAIFEPGDHVPYVESAVTKLAVDRLGLAPGKQIHALIKGVAIERYTHAPVASAAPTDQFIASTH